jgi:hypothetical protein
MVFLWYRQSHQITFSFSLKSKKNKKKKPAKNNEINSREEPPETGIKFIPFPFEAIKQFCLSVYQIGHIRQTVPNPQISERSSKKIFLWL